MINLAKKDTTKIKVVLYFGFKHKRGTVENEIDNAAISLIVTYPMPLCQKCELRC